MCVAVYRQYCSVKSAALTRADGLNVGETLLAGLRSPFILTLYVSECVRVHC